jgi:hypothetical protein
MEETQADEDAEPGIDLNEAGQLVLTTEEGVQVAVNPAPKDPDGLVDALPEDSNVEIDENSQVLITVPDEKADDLNQTIITVFDPLITDAPENSELGLNIDGEGPEATGVFVYDDKTAQEIKPAVLTPDYFEEAASNFNADGVTVEDVRINADGTATIILKVGEATYKVTLIPDFKVTPAPEEGGVDPVDPIDPNIDVNEDGNLEYVNGDGDSQKLYVGDFVPVEGDVPPPGEGS